MRCSRWAAGQDVSVQYLRNRLNNSFDAGAPYFDDRTVTTLEAWSVVSRNRIGEKWNSILTVGEGSDDSVSLTAFGESPFKTTQRQYTWQNDWTLPLGVLSLALERREERVATDSDFAVDAAEHELGDGRLPGALPGVRAPGEPASRRLEPVRGQDDRRHRRRLQAEPAVAG